MKPRGITKLGLIADIQYCDINNKWNYEKTRERFYRNSINHLDNSLNYFRENKCDKVLQLGDLLDGYCRVHNDFSVVSDLIGKRFESYDIETFHVTGNHELYNFTREEFCNSFLGKSLKQYQDSNIDLNYYKVNLTEKICLIVLDTYEISVLNRRDVSNDNTGYFAAKKILEENNKNESWNDPIGATKAKYVGFNGGIGEIQLKWLEERLKECSLVNNIVIIAGHIPIVDKYKNPLCLLWNDEDLVELIHRYPCVKAYLCGHAHWHSTVITPQFIQITMPGIIEAKPGQRPFGILEITDTYLAIRDMPDYWPNHLKFSF